MGAGKGSRGVGCYPVTKTNWLCNSRNWFISPFSVEQNVGLVPSLERWKPLQIKARVWELLQLVGLEPSVYAKRYPQQLSGGQRQRVGVARALAADPPILLLDEPFGALDPITRLELQQEFHRLRTKLNKTAIFVTHDVGEAFRLGTRIGLMYEGELVVMGTPQEFRQAAHPEARRFLQCLQVGLSLEEA
ncbi:MAG: ATP-binding cassette domain-containing protein [Chloroflexaceae bacterium]|nr:ATP-binding cassette domain-containing protein [Chloroflexaceae bacterium]